MNKKDRYIEILDTTLRDGEQTPGVAYAPQEKLQIANILLEKLKVDRIEVGSARVSEGEREGVRKIFEWAEKKGCHERIEILGFCDKGKSVDWICSTGVKVINLLTKGSERHCRVQLGKTPEEHFQQVGEEIEYAVSKGLKVNVYLEDWSGGMRDSFPYVFAFIKSLENRPVERIMLPDTLGILNPAQTSMYLQWLRAFAPDLRLDFHGHNDYGLVTANSLAAVKGGVTGIHTTVNGLGERTGNQNLFEAVAVINDMTGCHTRVDEKVFDYASKTIQMMSGKRVAANAPIVGADVFTQTCGVHADGDKKGNLYANALLPERFSRKRQYALGKLSGKASIDQNLDEMGLDLPKEVRDEVLREVIRLGDKKKSITPEDLPFIIADIMKSPSEKRIAVKNYSITNCKGVMPVADVCIEYNGKEYTESSEGDGGYDAFVRAVRTIMDSVGVEMPRLLDYEVRIPPGGKTDALVEATITWESHTPRAMVTIGVDSDQLVAAIQATEKMLNLITISK